MTDEQRALERDASRYRWWRDNYGSAYDSPISRLLYTVIPHGPLGTHKQFDAAIDAAMQEPK